MSSNSDRSVPSNARPGNARPGLARPHVSLSDASSLRSPIATRLPLQAPERTPEPEKVQPRPAPPPPAAAPPPEPIPEPIPVASAAPPLPNMRPRRGRMWVIALAAAIPVVGLVIAAEIVAPDVLPWNASASAGSGGAGGDAAVAAAERAPAAATAPEEGAVEAFEEAEGADPEPLSGGAAPALGGSAEASSDDPTASQGPLDGDDEEPAQDAQPDGRSDPAETETARRDTRTRPRADARRDESRRSARRGSRSQRAAERAEGDEDDGAERASAEPGFLTIDAKPYATVRVAGHEIGDTPIVRHALPPGDHVLEVAFSTGEVRRMRVTIDSGGVVRRRVSP